MKIILEAGDECPHCQTGTLELVKGNGPYNVDHLQCDNCDSTYNLNENIIKNLEK